jgi:hypothetical protein
MKKKKDPLQFYVGIEGDPPDKFTRDNMYTMLEEAHLSAEFEGVELNGKVVKVWKVTHEFVTSLYDWRKSLPLKFVVCAYVNSIFQQFCLLDPVIKKKARQARYLAMHLK